VAVDLPYAYILSASPDLQILDVRSPSEPVEVGYLPPFADDYGRDIVAASGFAYAATADGLYVIDATVPESPVVAATLDTPGFPQGVALAGDLLYVADFSGGLRVVDVADPRVPQEIGHVRFPGFAMRVSVVDEHAFVAAAHGGLRVINISQPTFPYEVGNYPLESDALGIAVARGLAVLAGRYDVATLDVSNPRSPVLLDSVSTPWYSNDVALEGNHAYVANTASGVLAYDLTDPLSMELIASADLSSWPRVIEASEGFLWVGENGLVVLADCWTRLFSDGFESGDLGAWTLSGSD
jgi:hypothetical protein